jgi:hypothetical protein
MSSLETGLDGKVILVTGEKKQIVNLILFAMMNYIEIFTSGASSGIGKYTAIEFSKNNCRLAICGRNVEKLNATAKECGENLRDSSKVKDIYHHYGRMPVSLVQPEIN